MSEAHHYYLVTPLTYTGAAGAFTYRHNQTLIPGQIVQIPIGRRLSLGVIAESVPKPTFITKPIGQVLEIPPVPNYLRQLAAWMSQYYAASPSATWSAFLPAGLEKTRRSGAPLPDISAQGLPTAPLTAEQSAVLNAIRASSQRTHLIQGVTGSGKTRIYLELAAEALATGSSCLVLVPEILLTPQIVSQFENAFGSLVLATHSKLTPAQRHRIWDAATVAYTSGQPRIAIGPRSSLFLPLHSLKLIIVDECHESSYKQEQHPRYHTVPTAAKLAALTGARLVLGSATPSLNELFLAQQGRIQLHRLTKRVNDLAHDKAIILDMRDKSLFKLSKFIAQPLYQAITNTLADSRQSLLYLNRRGSASSQVCSDCGHITTCPNCQLPLTFHADLLRFICHHCNYRRTSEAVCPNCGAADLRLLGGGTKRIEAEVERLWPKARIARLDRDSATLSHLKAVYQGLRQGTIDILIGTQMITKGLDLPAIDTVGVINADTLLHVADFNAAERTFQLLSQVSGRAGRGDRPGQVFIQTYTPDHPAIQAAATNDYTQFAAAEQHERQALHYPPYTYLLKLTIAATERSAAIAQASELAAELRRRPHLEAIGPAPAFVETVGNRYHWILTVKSPQRSALVDIAQNLPSPHWSADLDPVNLL